MINTYNESHLHKTFKEIYRLNNPDSITEAKCGNFIADIITKEGNIIEIQTANLSSLKNKCQFYLNEGKKVTVVYPLPVLKYIETENPQTGKTTKRKSPLKKSIYSVFKELTGLKDLLLNKNLTIEVVEISYTEKRTTEENKTQSFNNRRRHLREWNKTGKELESIGKKWIFNGKKDYLTFIPQDLPEEFSAKDFCTKIIEEQSSKNVKEEDLKIMLWLYVKMGLIFHIGNSGKKYIYSLKK